MYIHYVSCTALKLRYTVVNELDNINKSVFQFPFVLMYFTMMYLLYCMSHVHVCGNNKLLLLLLKCYKNYSYVRSQISKIALPHQMLKSFWRKTKLILLITFQSQTVNFRLISFMIPIIDHICWKFSFHIYDPNISYHDKYLHYHSYIIAFAK